MGRLVFDGSTGRQAIPVAKETNEDIEVAVAQVATTAQAKKKEVPAFAWKLTGYADGLTLTLLKSVEKADAEAQKARLEREGYYKQLMITPIDAPVPPPPNAKRRERAKTQAGRKSEKATTPGTRSSKRSTAKVRKAKSARAKATRRAAASKKKSTKTTAGKRKQKTARLTAKTKRGGKTGKPKKTTVRREKKT